MQSEDISAHLASSVERFLAGGALDDDEDEEEEYPFQPPVEMPAPEISAIERLTMIARNSQPSQSAAGKVKASSGGDAGVTDSGTQSSSTSGQGQSKAGPGVAFQRAISQALGKAKPGPQRVPPPMHVTSASPVDPAGQATDTLPSSVESVTAEEHKFGLVSMPDPASMQVLSFLIATVEDLRQVENQSAAMLQEIQDMGSLLASKCEAPLMPGEARELAAAVQALAEKQLQLKLHGQQAEPQQWQPDQFQVQQGHFPMNVVVDPSMHDACLERGAQVAMGLRKIPVPVVSKAKLLQFQKSIETIIRSLYKDKLTPDLKQVEQQLEENGYSAEEAALTLLVCAHDPATFTLWISGVGQVCVLLSSVPIFFCTPQDEDFGGQH